MSYLDVIDTAILAVIVLWFVLDRFRLYARAEPHEPCGLNETIHKIDELAKEWRRG